MAFSKSPSKDTYQTKPLKLIWSLFNKETITREEAVAVNGFFEIIRDKVSRDDDYKFVKRSGVSAYPYSLSSAIRGLYYWEDQDKLFIAENTNIYIVTGSSGILVTAVTPFTTTTGEVGFTEFNYEDGTTKVVAGDGTRLVTIDSANTVVVGSSPDQPTAFQPSIIFLDGYLFLIKTGTADIYNSALNDPLTFVAGDFLTAEMLPDTLFRISRLNNYLVAFGSSSVEYFFDAGNATGSPLQRNDTPVKHLGFLGGLASVANKIFFVGQSQTTAPEVFMLEDFKIESLSPPAMRRQMQSSSVFYASIISMKGRDFYCLSFDSFTYMMDIETKLWTKQKLAGAPNFPIVYATNIPISGKGNCSVFSIASSVNLFVLDPTSYIDTGGMFTVSVTTYKATFETMRQKFGSRFLVRADRSSGNLAISWTDDDYQTFSTPRNVDLASPRPRLHQLGKFTDRSFRFEYTHNASLTLLDTEIDFNIGAS